MMTVYETLYYDLADNKKLMHLYIFHKFIKIFFVADIFVNL